MGRNTRVEVIGAYGCRRGRGATDRAGAARAEPEPARATGSRRSTGRRRWPTTWRRRRRCSTEHGLAVESFQSNHEGELVDAIHGARRRCAAIIINPGAFTHYAWSIHDALAAFDGPVVELHLSNPNAREPWRHTSVVAPVAKGSIVGFGGHGYALAAAAVAELLGRGA